MTYPRRRQVGSDVTSGSRLAIYAAIFLAVTAFIVGALLVGFARPAGPGGGVAAVTPTPGVTLPAFEQPTPDATPTPLATPTPSPAPLTPAPSLTPGVSVDPVATPTPTTVVVTPTPAITPSPTPRPTRSPTPTPRPTGSPTPTPQPTPTQAAFTCQGVSGNPDQSAEVGSIITRIETGNWCLETATFQFFEGSAYGTIRLLHNGRAIASFTCSPPDVCGSAVTMRVRQDPRLALRGDALRFVVANCEDAPQTAHDDCENPGVIARITVGYERAIRP